MQKKNLWKKVIKNSNKFENEERNKRKEEKDNREFFINKGKWNIFIGWLESKAGVRWESKPN